jgi:hypothetical protein
MKVTRNTDSHLVIDSAPWLLAVILMVFAAFPLYGGTKVIFVEGMPGFGIGILVVGALFLLPFFWAFVRRNQLILDRAQGRVIFRRRTIFGYSQNIYDLAALQHAEVQSQRSDGNDIHRMVLRFEDEVRPFVDSYASGSGAEQMARAVNDWLGVSHDLDSPAPAQ